MIASLKIVLAIWTAAFLALPTCPCQLFDALGVDYPHRHEAGEGGGNLDYNGITELKSDAGQSDDDLPFCHCHEGIGNTAEKCEEDTLSTKAKHSASLSEDLFHFDSQSIGTSRMGRAPPPSHLHARVLLRSMTGVYRL